MDRSRADDVLREWSTVAKNARRPFSAPKPRLTRSALPAGLLAGATLVVAIVFVIGFGSRSNQPVASGSPTPSASATASATASASPSASGIASPTATAVASQVAGTPASVVASVPNCDITVFSGSQHLPAIVSGGDIFIECALPDSGREIVVRVNLATNMVVKAYATYMGNGIEQRFAVVGGALWVEIDNGSGCSLPCLGFLHVFRIDLVSGNVTLDLVDRSLAGVESGYVLVADLSGHVFKLDPATGDSKGQVPPALAGAEEVCGSLWVRSNNYSDNTTSFERLDPANGKVLASFTEPGTVADLQQVGNECWAVEDAYSLGPDKAGPDLYQFIRIAPSGIDFRSPILHEGTHAAIFDGTFWMLTPGAADPMTPVTNSNPLTTMQRIDPATWQPAGPVWTYTGSGPAFAAGGSLWAAQAGSPSWTLDRLDVPLGAIGS
jgi:hypothetical protein